MSESRKRASEETKVSGVICPVCKDGIYSVARHDFHYCSCGATYIDGGFDYCRTGSSSLDGTPNWFTVYVPVGMTELYEDYRNENLKTGRKWGTLDRDALRRLVNQKATTSLVVVAPKAGSTKKAVQRKGRA